MLPRYLDLIKLWTLADYLQVPKLQNTAMDYMWQKKERPEGYPTIKAYHLAYEILPPDSPVQRFLVLLAAGYLETGRFAELPSAMVLDLAIFLNDKYPDRIRIRDQSRTQLEKFKVKED